MHNFKEYLIKTYKEYPNSLLKDYLKLIYQSEFAGGHMIKSKQDSLAFILEEISISNNANESLYEYISNNIVRINLSAYKNHSLDYKLLNNIFYESANLLYQNKNINHKINILIELIQNNIISISDFSKEKIENFKKNPLPTHHSDIYNKLYKPHYRIINLAFLPIEFRVLKLQKYIDSLPSNKLTIIALEGRCASGKSTITNKLNNVTIIHADDFFSKTDLLNFDALDKVLSKLKLNEKLEYTVYNCMNDTYQTKIIEKIKPVVIVEGVYSFHQKIRNYYDKLIYVETSKELQISRLKARTNSQTLYDKFINIWVPREEEYYNSNNYVEISDIII